MSKQFKIGQKVVVKNDSLMARNVPKGTIGEILGVDYDFTLYVEWAVGGGDKKWWAGFEDVAKVHDLNVGDKVRIRKWIDLPYHGWGDLIKHKEEVGTVMRVRDDMSVYVDWPCQKGWHGRAYELSRVKEEVETKEETPDYSTWIGKVVRVKDDEDEDFARYSVDKYRVLIQYDPSEQYPFTTQLYEGGELMVGCVSPWKFAELDEEVQAELDKQKVKEDISYLNTPLTNGLRFTHKGKEYGVIDISCLGFNGQYALFTDTESDGRSFVKPKDKYIDCPYANENLVLKDWLEMFYNL